MILFFLALTMLAASVFATDASTEARMDLAAARPLVPLSELVLSGENSDTVPRAVTVRIDDRIGADYSDRVNEERVMPPGPFTLRLRLASLKTPRHRPLDLAAAWRVIAFAPNGGRVTFAPLRLDSPRGLPPGVRGWYFGPGDTAPLSGFDPVTPGDPRISGPHVEQISRPGNDPVLAHGVRLTRFAAPLPPGNWRLTLWTEDPGEWETLPVVLQQRIRVNGQDLFMVNRDYAGWIDQRYLAGRAQEANPAAPPFASIAAGRGGRVSGVVTVGPDGMLTVELAGFPQPSTHLSAMTAEPADAAPAAEAAVEAVRAARFSESWPVLTPPPPAPRAASPLAVSPVAQATTAPGGLAILRTVVTVSAPATAQTSVAWEGHELPSRLLWGQWRWRRPGANVAGLVFSDAHLRADSQQIPLRADLPRKLVLVATVPPETAPGIYRGHLRIKTGPATAEAPFSIEVVHATRPAPAARVGPFLGFAPQLLGTPEWSKDTARSQARMQAACDVKTLAALGFTQITAPLMPPDVGMDAFIGDLRSTLAHFAAPAFGYETLRAMAASMPAADAAARIAAANAAIKAAGLPPVVWSLADEPAYSGTTDQVLALAASVHAADPAARLSGHLNDRRDAVLLPALSVVTVNPGFGADAADIEALRGREISPWLYNMPRPRLAAGSYLWRSGADGLLQWHARMPTADAFDPTDGREGDVQFLWPTPGVCAPADLDEDLLTLAEGQEDLRWFAWLDRAAQHNPDAARLRQRLHEEVPGTWQEMQTLPDARATLWRNMTADVARKIGY